MNERDGDDGGLTPRQQDILGAAAEVFSERGYAKGSMREIATRVGVSEPALYRHFPGKRELFLTMVRVVGRRVRRDGEVLLAGIGAENVREGIVTAVDNRRQAAARYAPLLRAVLDAAASEPEVLEAFRVEVAEPLIANLTEKAAEIDTAFGVPAADETRADRVRAVLALLIGTVVSSFALGDRPDEAAAEAVLRVMGWDRPA